MIGDQFTAVPEKRRQIGIHGSVLAAVHFLGYRHVPVDIESSGIPVRIPENDVAEKTAADVELRRGIGGPELFAGRSRAREPDLALAADDTGIDTPRRRDLVRAKAFFRLTFLTLSNTRIETAGSRVGDDIVLDTVRCITGVKCRLSEYAELAHAQFTGPQVVMYHHTQRGQRGEVAGRRAGNNGIVIIGITLCFLQSLAAAGRTTVPV